MIDVLMMGAGVSHQDRRCWRDEAKEEPIALFGNKRYRQLAQTLGTEWGRKLIDDDLWVNLALNDVRRQVPLVIDDVRFPNEYWAIIMRGGEIWRVTREGAKRPNNHASEGLLDHYDFDRLIENNGTLQELYQQLNNEEEYPE